MWASSGDAPWSFNWSKMLSMFTYLLEAENTGNWATRKKKEHRGEMGNPSAQAVSWKELLGFRYACH